MPAPNPVRELIRRELLDLTPYGSYQERYELHERFEKRPGIASDLDYAAAYAQADQRLAIVANRDWIIAGTGAVSANSTLDPDGGASLSTAAVLNNQIIARPATPVNLVPISPWNTVEWQPDHAARVECIIELPALAALRVHAGFGLTPTLNLTTDADQAKLVFDTAGATSTVNWTAATSIGGVDTEVDTTTPALAGKTIRLAVEISNSRVPRFYINGVKKVTGAALTAGVNFIPFVGIQTLEAVAKTIKVRSIRGSRLLNPEA